MPFAIKVRRLDGRSEPAETLAIDIENREEACGLVQRLAGSYPENGRQACHHAPPARWFRSRAGLHVIWAQAQ